MLLSSVPIPLSPSPPPGSPPRRRLSLPRLQFSLVSGFVKWLLSKTEVQLLILGIDHAGKTVRCAGVALALRWAVGWRGATCDVDRLRVAWHDVA